ncbi:MAG: energy transducer TonB [Verrucomicrobiia bacterium]|jgi:protein TonB
MTAKDTLQFIGPPLTARPTDSIAHIGMEPSDDASLVPVATFVTWMVCLAVGILGLLLPYSRVHPFVKVPEPVKVEKLFVQLGKETITPTENERQPGNGGLLAALPSDEMAPPPIPVAEPSAAIAFAVPVEGATRVVPFGQAAYGRPSKPVPTVQRLTFGVGEGQQASPEYPREAIEQHQEGTVVIRLVVGESGLVTSAEVIHACPWPLLNESAVRTVRHQWRFAPGAVRTYDVPIHFQITSQ